jgi:hypothetical protein
MQTISLCIFDHAERQGPHSGQDLAMTQNGEILMP